MKKAMPWEGRSPGPDNDYTIIGDKKIMTLDELTQVVTGLAVNQAQLTDTVASLASSVQVLQAGQAQQSVAIDRLIEAQIQTFDRFDAMQSEIRGLQTENRRILERLEGLTNNDD
jgi:hypothetical protein